MQRSSIIRRISALACIALLLSGCGMKSSAKPLPQLIIGCDDYQPYNYIDEDGEPDGIDVEIAREACRRMGYEPVFKQIEWSKRNRCLAKGEVDCLWSGLSMDEPYEYSWVGPYMYGQQVVAVLQDSDITSLNDLEGKRIAVKVSSKTENIFQEKTDENIPNVQDIYSLSTIDEVVSALCNDYVDACAGYAASLTELLENIDVEYRFLDENLASAEIGIAFSKESNADLRQKLEDTLEEMRIDGTIEHILEGYGLETNLDSDSR